MADNEPLVKLEAQGQAAILSYNVPDPTSYPGRFNLGLNFGFVSDQQAIFKGLAASVAGQSTVPPKSNPVLMYKLGAALLQATMLPDETTDTTSDLSSGSGPVIDVNVPILDIDMPSSFSATGTSVAIPLRAQHDLDSPEPTTVKFQVSKIGGSSVAVTASRSGTDPHSWTASWQATATGRYTVSLSGTFKDSRQASRSWINALKHRFDVTLTTGTGTADQTPPDLTVTVIGTPPFSLDSHGNLNVQADILATDPQSAVTMRFLIDGQVDVSPQLTPQAAGVQRYTTTFHTAGRHVLRVEAINAAGLVTARETAIQVNPTASVPIRQHLVLIYSVQLSNYLGSYGAGRTIQTFSLLPGEKTRISIKTYQSTTTTATEAQSIMDGFDETSADDFQNAVTNETGTKANDSSQFAAAAKVEASGSWGFASARVEGSVSGGSASALEQFSKNVSNAVAKHTASKSARRQAQVNYSTTSTSTSGTENVIERTIENINVSRTLNFVFRQLNQEFVSLQHLTDVRIAHVRSNPVAGGDPPWFVNEVTLAEMESLVRDVVNEQYVEAVINAILAQLYSVRDYQGNVVPVIERVAGMRPKRDANNQFVYDTTHPDAPVLVTEPDGSSYLRFRPMTQTYRDTTGNTFTVPGVILNVSKNTLRSDGVIVEALLGQANALDDYSTQLQAQTVRQRELQNDELSEAVSRDALAREVVEGVPAEARPDAFAKVFPIPDVDASNT